MDEHNDFPSLPAGGETQNWALWAPAGDHDTESRAPEGPDMLPGRRPGEPKVLNPSPASRTPSRTTANLLL